MKRTLPDNRRLANSSLLNLQQLVLYETSAAELDIIRDISRTFPSHVFFQQRHGPGQRALYNVLKAYSVYDRDVGYVQVKILSCTWISSLILTIKLLSLSVVAGASGYPIFHV